VCDQLQSVALVITRGCNSCPCHGPLCTQVHNPCWIPADCKLFTEGKHSAFSVEPREVHVRPGETVTATVSVCMDDTRVGVRATVCACVWCACMRLCLYCVVCVCEMCACACGCARACWVRKGVSA